MYFQFLIENDEIKLQKLEILENRCLSYINFEHDNQYLFLRWSELDVERSHFQGIRLF